MTVYYCHRTYHNLRVPIPVRVPIHVYVYICVCICIRICIEVYENNSIRLDIISCDNRAFMKYVYIFF